MGLFYKKYRVCQNFDITRIGTVIFSGGGNRCWWQAGLVSHLLNKGWQLPKRLVGTSAGAAMAASCITDGPEAALDSCTHLFSMNKRIFDWNSLLRLKLRFAHQHTYPAWIDSFVNKGNFLSIRNSKIRLTVAVTRPAKHLGLSGSVALGTLAYVFDKYIWHSVHPRLPRYLGLRQDFFDLHQCGSISEAHALLNAAAGAPPFLPAIYVDNNIAIDGGFTDNVPIPALSFEEKSRSLVLLTRYYPHLPQVFRCNGLTYWQPSHAVPVSTWDCTYNATIQKAFLLGKKDAEVLMKEQNF